MFVLSQLLTVNEARAATTIRVNSGGPAQTVGGVQWSGCDAPSSCGGWVTGGAPWAENPSAISGVVSPDSQTIEKTEWTWGRQNGVPFGGTAFSYNFPLAAGSYDVTLHFTELNKTASGQRVFDVNINGATKLSYFDIFQQAGGANKTITRTFRVSPVNGKIAIDFIARTENAKVSAIEVVSADGSLPTTTNAPVTTTTQAPPAGNSLTWSNAVNSPHYAVEAAGNAFEGKLYTFGGYLPGSWVPTSSAYVYDVGAGKWSSLPATPRSITHSTTAIDGRSLVLAGGYTANGSGQTFAINNVWRFDVDSQQWSNLPSLPQPRGSGGMVKVGRTLHFLGGVDANRVEKSDHWTLNLDNVAAGWQPATAFPYPRTHFATLNIGNSIYTVGGLVGIDDKSTQLSGVYRFDTISNTWSPMKALPSARSHISDSSFVRNGKIYVMGGEYAYGKSAREVFVYDAATNSWSLSTPLPWARFSGVASLINGTVYFATGDLNSNAVWKGTFS